MKMTQDVLALLLEFNQTIESATKNALQYSENLKNWLEKMYSLTKDLDPDQTFQSIAVFKAILPGGRTIILGDSGQTDEMTKEETFEMAKNILLSNTRNADLEKIDLSEIKITRIEHENG